MRYWVLDERTRKVHGPYLVLSLPGMKGFGPEMKVAPEGARGPEDWKRVKDVDELKVFVPAPAAPPPAPPAEKKKG